MSFSLLLHFNQIKDHPQALAIVWQAWQKHFMLPLLLFRGKGPGQSVSTAQLKKLAKFVPKDTELNLRFKESLKRTAARLEVLFTNPLNDEFAEADFADDEDGFGDLNYLSATLSDAWFQHVGAAAAEAAVVGFIVAVAQIGKLKDADFEHDDIALNAPGLDLFRAISGEFHCNIGHLFFANARMLDAYSLANWKKAGFQIHAKWKEGWLVGLPLNYEPNTIEAAWRLFDALENLGAYRRGQIKPHLVRDPGILHLSQAGVFLATYEKKLGRVFGSQYSDRIRPNEDSTATAFGTPVAFERPIAKPKKASKEAVSPVSKTTKKLQPIPAVPHQSELDEIFEDFSRAFIGRLEGATPIAFPAQLARDQLDYSLDSLKLVDTYLSYLHKHKKKISDADWNSTVLYGGAYVGEVIRRATGGQFRWIDYEEYMPAHPELQALIPERNSATCAFLVDGNDSMTMPLNKIARYVDEGMEHSVHFFAHCDIQGAKRVVPKKKSSKKELK